MVKKILLFTMLPANLVAFADEPTDTIKTQELNEVVVEAQMQNTTANSTTYYPDRNSKRSAQNAIDLLNQMNIPQINVNPISGSVQTPSGDDVAIFIDMEPATQEEKDALRPEDVKKVEYLMFPSDPRYNHEKYVINITLRHYDYGGYAKVSGTENVLAGSGSGLAYAKMAYKRMTYDISVNDKYTDRHNTGDEQIQVFRFPDANGSIDEITRSNLLDYSRFQQNQIGASFRAKYTTEKVILSNSVYFTAQNTPHSDNSGRLLFSSDLFQDGTYSNTLNSTYLYPRWRGNYYFDLGRNFKLNVIPSLFYEHTKYRRLYNSDETNILTDAKENAITGQLQFQLNKTFNNHHTLDINLLGIYYYDKVEYSGNTSVSPVFNQFAYGGFLGYSFNKGNFYGQLVGGFAGESNKISGVRTNSFIPLAELNAQYAFNQKNSLNVSAQYYVNAVRASDKTPDIIQENELLYKVGNVHLKNTNWTKATIDYTWLPNNKFSVSAFSGWSRYFNHPVPVFTPDGPNGMMLRSIENNGDYQDFYIGGTLSAKLLNRSLVFRLTPRMWFEKMTGMYADNANYLSVQLSATYYLKNLYFSAYYSSASRGLVQYSLESTSVKSKPFYQLKVGWSNGKWNCSVAAVNIFRRSWINQTSCLKSQWFDQYTTEYNASSHQFVSITASYTFGFGKKIKHGDEIQNVSGGNSAIMK
ncbi:hypothetical protein [uncultured Duncaniella sp.]|uniref:hypothetical protein n=4 Tax=uncultured Duncaniella sp. TaxID=2768039 RepID=UPI00265E0059|nr:hypothetical protein [uncultured Duncaniella sp.]